MSIRHLLAIVAALAFVALPACAAVPPVGYLHRQHTQIVDGTGKPVHLRGVNLGNWLLIEPWMTGVGLGIYGGEDSEPDTFGDAVVDVVGKEKAEAFTKTWRDNYITEADVKRVKELGFNSVRVPMDYRLFYADGKDVDTGFEYLDNLLVWCAEEKIYVIPDMHSVPGGKLNYKTGNIFGDTAKQDRLAHIWQRIATRYKDNPWIGGWDLINEPGRWDDKHMSLGTLYKKVTTSIRAVDMHHMIIVEGDHWGSRLDAIGIGSDTAKPWDDNIAYSDHDYGATLAVEPDAKSGKYDNQYGIPSHRLLTKKLDVPLWLGEFGYNSNPWTRSMIREADAPTVLRQDGLTADAQVGWCLWAYKARALWTPVCVNVPKSMSAINDYWEAHKKDPNAPKPSVDVAFAALMDYAASTKLSACTTNIDVVDALTRPDFATKSVRFTKLTIPGRIDAIDYDMGNEGVAYHDQVSTDEAGKGPAGRPWNSGWNFRNDGVDIYPETDGPPGFILGGTEDGDWTTYTVTCKPGAYSMLVRYSAPSGGGKLRVEIGGVDVGGGAIALDATGAWNSYRTLTIPVKVKASGASTMKLSIVNGGFNVNWVEFKLRG